MRMRRRNDGAAGNFQDAILGTASDILFHQHGSNWIFRHQSHLHGESGGVEEWRGGEGGGIIADA